MRIDGDEDDWVEKDDCAGLVGRRSQPNMNQKRNLGDWPKAISSILLLVAMPFVPSSFLLLVVRPGATSSVLAPSSDALSY